MSHGVVIGKFYPPHAGHHGLLRTAALRVDRLTVIVMSSAAETIALADRVAWLREEHPDLTVTGIVCDAPLDLGDDQVWCAQVAAMRAALRQIAAPPVDVVFTGEGYGERLADYLGARWQSVPRASAGVSGSVVRADLAGEWGLLAPATKAGIAVRVVVLGAESSGTTTLSMALAEHYRTRGGVWAETRWVPEYGRELTATKWARAKEAAREAGLPEPAVTHLVWNADDFDAVASEQTRREEALARTGSPVLICDTDAFATAVWEGRYLGESRRNDPAWARPPLLPRHDIYLLTDHAEVPWDDDGLREGDLQTRAAMTGWFADGLTRAGHSWVLVTGTQQQRLRLSVRTIDQLLAVRARFGSPYSGPGFESLPAAAP